MTGETAPLRKTQVREVLAGDLDLRERARSEQLFRERYDHNLRRIDRIFAALMIVQWVLGVVIAVVVSPHGWAGKGGGGHVQVNAYVHLYLALFFGGILSALPLTLVLLRPGQLTTRLVIACAQMLWSALLIHLTGGRIETHFHIFGSLAFLAFYRDWRVLVPATALMIGDHLARQLYWPESVYGIANPEWWRFLEHAFWVLFEDVFLVIACIGGVREMRSIANHQARVEHTEQLSKEMEIASRIQTSILPGTVRVAGLEIAAMMRPATEVGGDYYDVIPLPAEAGGAESGCWIGIGDVAGHGLKAGLIMLQAQSAFEALASGNPDASPRDLLCRLNQVMFENVRRRMKGDEHMTMSLVRYHADGRIVVAGAHEEIIVCRASDGTCRSLPVAGTWIGGMADIRPFTEETEHRLQPGDLMVLYSDGLTEAMDEDGQLFGPERVSAMVAQHHLAAVDQIRDRVVGEATRWSKGKFADDVTLLVIRHVGVVASAAAA